MKRPESHQIDELARRVLQNALPTAWVLNPHTSDYAKDYHLEIGDPSGELTGSSCYVQLKGQKSVDFDPTRNRVTFALESKHARYYCDRVKDLPVFLVVVDVTTGQGWYQFLQPALTADQSWRRKKTHTVKIPATNSLTDPTRFRAAIEGAKRWLRLVHPTAIPEAVAAQNAIGARDRSAVRCQGRVDRPWTTRGASRD